MQCECIGDSGWSSAAGAWTCRRSWFLRRSFGLGVYRGWAGCLGKRIGEVVVLPYREGDCVVCACREGLRHAGPSRGFGFSALGLGRECRRVSKGFGGL